ncbi:hypothetical protein [Deinococcus koreensis]|nr:hypothetical protein [Deinococcus koreensis]
MTDADRPTPQDSVDARLTRLAALIEEGREEKLTEEEYQLALEAGLIEG